MTFFHKLQNTVSHFFWVNKSLCNLFGKQFFFINEDKNMPLFIINIIADFKQQTMNKQKQLHNILIAI